tara:strand:- start:163 stop:318 length:156 start_codon:yes stop_codon:yes gene_type:complete
MCDIGSKILHPAIFALKMYHANILRISQGSKKHLALEKRAYFLVKFFFSLR